MSRTILPTAALDILRGIGDHDPPKLASVESRDLIGAKGIDRPMRDGGRFQAPDVCPTELDAEKLGEAQRLFAIYRTEIAGALLLAALPQSYAAEFGAGVLAANGELQNDLARRIKRTSLFLLTVMQQAFDDEDQNRLWDCRYGGPQTRSPVERSRTVRLLPWQQCVDLRGYHGLIRASLDERRKEEASEKQKKEMERGGPRPDGPITQLLGEHNAVPLNQEDLLAVMLTFSITVFEVLERYGISWTADQQESYLHVWDVIGAYLGIGVPKVVQALEAEYKKARRKKAHLPPPPLVSSRWFGLRPPSVDDARALLEQIRARQWKDPSPDGPFELGSWTGLRAGRILTRALLDELQSAMPGFLALEPITVMRALAPPIVRRRLNLGSNGLIVGAVARLPARRIGTGRFTVRTAPNTIAATLLHRMANDVTTRVATRFIEDENYALPDFGDWSTEGAWRG